MDGRLSPTAVALRHPDEADHASIVSVVDDWWGRGGTHALLPRLWLQHFTGTSFVAEARGRLLGFLVGFVSQDDPRVACLHLVGVAPGSRRRGIGRLLVDAFAAEARGRGARRMTAVAWPGDPGAISFLRATGFVVHAGPETTRLYGVPARTDWNREGDDAAVFDRDI